MNNRQYKKPVLKRISHFILSIVLCILTLTGCTDSSVMPPSGNTGEEVRITFIDVGQADAIFIRANNGQTMLIDSGNKADHITVLNFLKQQGVDTLDVFLASHPHEDHLGSAASIVRESNSIRKMMLSPAKATTHFYIDLLNALKETGTETEIPKVGDVFYLGDCKFTILGPVQVVDDINNNSLVVRMDYGEVSVLFMGDAELSEEKSLIEAHADLDADILKVGHHGSNTSTGSDFLKRVSPEYTVISVGADNDYGHPNQETLDQLENIKTYRTDINGTVTALITKDTIRFEVGKNAQKNENNIISDQPKSLIIGNKKSKIFHTDTCAALPKEENRIYFNTTDEAFSEGYRECKQCYPNE